MTWTGTQRDTFTVTDRTNDPGNPETGRMDEPEEVTLPNILNISIEFLVLFEYFVHLPVIRHSFFLKLSRQAGIYIGDKGIPLAVVTLSNGGRRFEYGSLPPDLAIGGSNDC
jgi:hypothetical protein